MALLGSPKSSAGLARLLFATLTLCLVTAPIDAFAEDIRGGSFARIVTKTNPPIRDLNFKSEYVPIEIRSKEKGPTPYAVLEGSFSRPDANLLFKQTKIRLSPTGEFRVSIPLTQKATPIQLVAVGVKGEVENQIIELDTDWASVLKRVQDRKMPRFKFTPGINFSMISYNETRLTETYSLKALTFKAGMSYLISPPRWSLDAGGYYTLLPISKSSDEVARFLGLNFRIGYAVPFVKDPWSLSIQAGLYYTSMFVTNNAFGFVNMAGPQVFPALRRSLRNGDALAFYFKLSPVTTGTAPLFQDREIAGGGAYVIGLKNGHTLPITLDISSFKLRLDDVDISSSTISLGFGYGF